MTPTAVLPPPEPLAPPVRRVEIFARFIVAASLLGLLYSLWTPNMDEAARWTAKELRVLPRMSVFVLAALLAMMLQGARQSGRALAGLGLAFLALNLLMLGWAPLLEVHAGGIEQFFHVAKVPAASQQVLVVQSSQKSMLLAGPFIELARFVTALFAALLLGTWAGRQIRSPMEFVALILCSAMADLWLSTLHVPESVDSTHVLSALRLPWPPSRGQLGLSPSVPDIVFLSAAIEAGRNLRFHLLSLVLGAVAGYCGASFLALAPWPSWPNLGMIMCGSGVVVGCWPDLRCNAMQMGKAFLISTVLLGALLLAAILQRKLNPVPPLPVDPARYRNLTRLEVGAPPRTANTKTPRLEDTKFY